MKTKKRLKKTIEAAASEMASSQAFSGPLATPDQKRLMYLKKIDEELEHFNDDCTKGFQLMVEEASSLLWGKEKTQFATEMLSILDKVDSDEKLDAYLPLIRSGKTWTEILPLSDFFMNGLYMSAKSLFNQGKYPEAISCFASLSWLDSHNYSYFLALGFSCFHAGRYEAAMSAYAQAAHYATDTTLFLYLADCFDKMGNVEKAQQSIEEGLKEELQMASSNKERISLFEKARQNYRSRR